MVSLFLTKCHKILDHHKVEVAVEIVVCFLKGICSVVFIEQKVSKILMSVINGDQDILKDETHYDYFVVFNNIWRCQVRYI